MQTIQDYQQQAGAQLEDRIPLSFGNDAAAIAAAAQGVALYDRSHWGRIQVSDRDRLSFLHNQTTNDLNRLQTGQGCETVLLNSTARTLDLFSVYVVEDHLLVLTSPQARSSSLTWLDRYIFFGDKVQLTDVTDQTRCFSLTGPGSAALLQELGVKDLPQALDDHREVTLAGASIQLACGSGLSRMGYTIIAAADSAALWDVLRAAGAIPLGEGAWEQLRIRDGRPMPGAELTEDYNPLEAGLWHTISFNKGCYIGQETIARLNTYNGVKQQLWGFQLSQPCASGTLILIEDQKVGVLTSVSADGQFGLGYLKAKAGGEGTQAQVGTGTALTTAVPFLTRQPADLK